ncbi:YraN family protein [Paracoccus albus]|uniref:YraN family protein n=1 Tax=Paracoccus albus TaxID=3017784 RepID=UPI0022F0A878|nr:YraN family protein [Paracoccus albus]WBU58965.1 YraN family protein [Paracoccus albus]
MQLTLDFDAVAAAMPTKPSAVRNVGRCSAREIRGRTSYDSGRLAEMSVADHYVDAGYTVVERRWRGKAGEIDMILRCGDQFVFTEVKSSKNFSRAADRISRRQMNRICMAASEYCDSLPSGQMTDMRMDAALVDQYGRVQIIEAAFGAE